MCLKVLLYGAYLQYTNAPHLNASFFIAEDPAACDGWLWASGTMHILDTTLVNCKRLSN